MNIPVDVQTFLDETQKKKGLDDKTFWSDIASVVKHADAEIEDKNAVLTRNTLAKFYPQWMYSFLQNIKHGYLDEFGDTNQILRIDEPYLILGAGPSLDKNIGLIKRFRGKILASDILLDRLLKHGIVPDYVMSLDGLPLVAKYFSTERVINRPRSISFICASTVNPQVIHTWLQGKQAGHIYFYHPYLEDPNKTFSISGTMQLWANKACLVTGGNVGTTGWYLANALEAAHAVMLGIDLAWYAGDLDSLNLRELPLTKDFLDANPNATVKEVEALYQKIENSFGNTVITDYVKKSYQEANIHIMEDHAQRFSTFQCSNYTILEPKGFECIEFEEYLDGPHKRFWDDKDKVR